MGPSPAILPNVRPEKEDGGASHPQLKDLPQAVQKAAQQEQANGTTLKGFAKEVEDGETFYEVETAVKGHTRDLL